jgi:phosphoenolpyruvate carboxylase
MVKDGTPSATSPPSVTATASSDTAKPSSNKQPKITQEQETVAATEPLKKVDGVFYVVHGMGPQLAGIGKFDDNLKNLRTACKQVLKEEQDDEETNIEFIPIEWHSLFHALDTGRVLQKFILTISHLYRWPKQCVTWDH